MKTVIIILGPTASGKTSISIRLAKEMHGEIISCDSMQVYKHMNIGTAKPTLTEMEGIPHFLIDTVEPNEEFSVAKYQPIALKYIKEIIDKGKLPIVTGGTGLYINSIVQNIEYAETVSDWELRERLTKEVQDNGNEALHEQLSRIDVEAAKRIHINDTKRIIRALEVYYHTGKTITQHQHDSLRNPSPYHFVLFGLTMPRALLYSRIDNRVDGMFEQGLVNEVKQLIELGYENNGIAMQALGYKEVLMHLKGQISLEDAKYIIKRDSRRYAKRQLTWFRRMKDIHWIDTSEYNGIEDIIKKMKYDIETSGIVL